MKLVKGHTLAELLEAATDPADDRPRFLAIFQASARRWPTPTPAA